MGPVQAIRTGFAKSFQFSGRASRAEFWWFVLFVCAVGIASTQYARYLTERQTLLVTYPVLTWGAVFALPLVSVAFRRLQDTGNNGLWIVIPILLWLASKVLVLIAVGLPPTLGSGAAFIVGAPIWLVLTLVIGTLFSASSDHGRNRYGPPPSEVTP